MKATELQCGDIVLVDGKPTRVYGVMERMNRIYDAMNNDISLKRCSGIPLTPDILEKNGWKNTTQYSIKCLSDPQSCLEYYFDKIRLRKLWQGIDERDNHYKSEITFQCQCSYVHELQRALRCCGLRELATNFKV